jgi:membrane fusion protein, multidrug efflux system
VIDGQSGNSETKKSEAASAEVNAGTIVAKTLPVTFEAVGQTEGSREVEVRLGSAVFCCAVFMPTGSWVKQGTLLFKIDPAPKSR